MAVQATPFFHGSYRGAGESEEEHEEYHGRPRNEPRCVFGSQIGKQ